MVGGGFRMADETAKTEPVRLTCWKCGQELGTISQHEFVPVGGIVVLTTRTTIHCGKSRAPETLRYDQKRLDAYRKRA